MTILSNYQTLLLFRRGYISYIFIKNNTLLTFVNYFDYLKLIKVSSLVQFCQIFRSKNKAKPLTFSKIPQQLKNGAWPAYYLAI